MEKELCEKIKILVNNENLRKIFGSNNIVDIQKNDILIVNEKMREIYEDIN